MTIELGHTAAYQLSDTNQLLIIHATKRRHGKVRPGYYLIRRWLRDPADKERGWEIDRWFEWKRKR